MAVFMGSSKKQTLFLLICRQSKPASLPELLAQLGPGFAQRSVRRWVAEMVDEGLVERVGQRRGTRYQISRREGISFSPQTVPLIEQVRRPLHQRLPATYDPSLLEGYRPNATFYLPDPLRVRLHEAGRRTHDHDPAGTYARHIFNRLLIDLSFNSSRLEGSTYSLLETEKLLLEGVGSVDKPDAERVMILNHKEAIRYLVDNAAQLEVNRETVCTLHYLLADGLVDTQFAGKLRDHGVRISGSTYLPLANPTQLAKQLSRVCEKGSQIEDPFEQSFFLLIHISYLQAFTDVNKRAARLSANIPLIRDNFVPISFNEVERRDYLAAIIAWYELHEVGPMVDLYSSSYFHTCQLYDSSVEDLGVDVIRVRYRDHRRAVLREVILHDLHGKAMQDWVVQRTEALVVETDRELVAKAILEDLALVDEARIVGLGITPEQLNHWTTGELES